VIYFIIIIIIIITIFSLLGRRQNDVKPDDAMGWTTEVEFPAGAKVAPRPYRP